VTASGTTRPGILASGINLLWSLIAATLLAAAVLVTTIRLLLPEITNQQDLMLSWVSEMVGRPVRVGAISAEWHGWAPRINIDDISVRDVNEQDELIRFDSARIDIAPLRSLLSGGLQPRRLHLDGVGMTVIRHEDGHFSVAGMPPPKSPMLQWILEQENFSVGHADITLLDHMTELNLALSNLSARVENSGSTRRIRGIVQLPAAFGRSLGFDLHADGDPTTAAWSGSLAIKLKGLTSGLLLEQLGWSGAPHPEGTVDFIAWTDWSDARLESGQVELRAFAAGQDKRGEPALATRGYLRRRAQGWQLELADMKFAQAASGTEKSGLSLAWETGAGKLQRVTMRGARLPLEPLRMLAANLDAVPEAVRSRLRTTVASGQLNRIEAGWRSDEQTAPGYSVTAEVAELTLTGPNHPDLEGWSFSIALQPDTGSARFAEATGSLRAPERFVAPLDVSGLDGEVAWRVQADGLIDLEVPRLRGAVNGTQFDLEGSLRALPGPAPSADLVVNIASADAARIHELVPLTALPPRGERWMRQAFHSGVLHDGHILLRGVLRDLPFRQAEGVLQAAFGFNDVTLEYSNRWPIAEGLSGELAVGGATITTRLQQGTVGDASISPSEIVLPDLFIRKRRLQVHGSAIGDGDAAVGIIMHSPLRNGGAARLQEVEIARPFEVFLDMDLPLYPGGPREILGRAHFADNLIRTRTQRIALEQVNGTMSFGKGSWQGDGLRASFDGMPVTFSARGGFGDPVYDTELRLSGDADAGQVVQELQRYAGPVHAWLARYHALDSLSGQLSWDAIMRLPRGDSGMPQKLSLNSNLRDFAVGLPHPIGKARGAVSPLHVEIDLRSGLAEQTRVTLSDQIYAEIDAVRDSDGRTRASRIEVGLGVAQGELQGRPDFNVYGYTPALPLTAWLQFLSREGDSSGNAGTELPLGFDLKVSHVDAWGQPFEDLQATGSRDPEAWRFRVSSPRLSGQFDVPRKLDARPIKLDLERLQLTPRTASNPSDASGERIHPARIPALEVDAQSFAYGRVELGKAHLVTTKAADGLQLEALRFADAELSVETTGAWTISDNEERSRFDIKVNSGSLKGLLGRFGSDVAATEGGKTELDINARWPGAPQEFSFERLSGNIQLKVEQGRLPDIEPGSGRVVGLFSLQTLRRRLALDFEDLFSKGFAFDRINGLFMIDRGDAYTNNLSVVGPAARIDASGRTGLHKRDYDLRIAVFPAVSDTLPVAGALFGPVGAGAGAVYYLGQKMFKSLPEQIDKLLRRDYSVTGPWNKPDIEKL